MRSELVNYLPISNNARLLLRALFETAMEEASLSGEDLEINYAIVDIDESFFKSMLLFTDAIKALAELLEEKLIIKNSQSTCSIDFRKVVAGIMNAIDPDISEDGQRKDFDEIKRLQSQFKDTGLTASNSQANCCSGSDALSEKENIFDEH